MGDEEYKTNVDGEGVFKRQLDDDDQAEAGEKGKTRVGRRREYDLTETPSRGTRIISDEKPDSEAREGLFAWLVATEGEHKGKFFQLFNGTNLVGRKDECHIQLSNQFVSGLHCVIRAKEGIYHIWDLGSVNGTKLNDEALTSAQELKDEDRILIGKDKFVFKRVDLAKDK